MIVSIHTLTHTETSIDNWVALILNINTNITKPFDKVQ